MSVTRRGTIRSCVRDLSQRLARRYGARDAYAPSEVASVLKDWEMHLSHPAYAYAIYCTRGDFERLDPALRAGRDYEEYRRDVRRQYPGIEETRPDAFARGWWAPLAGALSSVDRPDSFAPPQPAPARASRFPQPELGMHGVVLALAVGVGAVIGLALLVAYLLPRG